MTYAASQVGYWVGQANDNSSGTHPTGWTSGQRWSETAGEWQTMYDTQYATARDTSTGSHPVGWTNGQLWSETASEWQTMYNTEFAAARDNSSGQTGRPSGLQHPTGWTANQLWSETASEWNAMWVTEWNTARDPQGFSYSYPGQAANAVFWSQSAQYWRGQADYYWGPSRVWNSGATWEQNYNLYVGYYNDMVSQRDTWTSRANQAWGPNRVWNNGASWEQKWVARDNIADHNYSYASLSNSEWTSAPPTGGAWDNFQNNNYQGPTPRWGKMGFSGTVNANAAMPMLNVSNEFFAPVSGYYFIALRFQTSGGFGMRMTNSAGQKQASPVGSNFILGNTWIQLQMGAAQQWGTGMFWYGYIPAGQTSSFDSYSWYAVPIGAQLVAIFQPTRAYPGV
jgi:hypothetical protein